MFGANVFSHSDKHQSALARMVAKMKLHSLAEGARMVRKEVAGV